MSHLTLAKTDLKPGICEVDLPSSKSISNRLLVLRCLSRQPFDIQNLSTSTDTQGLQSILSDYPNLPSVIDVKDAGTNARFLTALLSITPGEWILTGTPRMQKRPIAPLVDALKELGADIHYQNETGFLPLKIIGKKLQGREIEIKSTISSQFISALLLISPALKDGLYLNIDLQNQVSKDYIFMTLSLMKEFGISIKTTEHSIYVKPNQHYVGKPFEVESDWSSASYWYNFVSLSTGGQIILKHLTPSKLQGDMVCSKIYEILGVKTTFLKIGALLEQIPTLSSSFEYDFSDCPDLVPAIAVCCAMHKIPVQIKGIEHLKYKESNRIEALKAELQKIGTFLSENGQCFTLEHSSDHLPEFIRICSHQDHRIAMAFSALCLRCSVGIETPEVVSKSYPNFYKNLTGVTFLPIFS